MKNNQYLNKMWVDFVDIVAEEGYNFDDLIDDEGRKGLSISLGGMANIIVKSDNINEAIKIVHRGLSEKHFGVNNFFRIDNLATLVENGTARQEDINTAKWLEKSVYVFKVSGRIWTYTSRIEDNENCADSIQNSNLWLIFAKDTKFEYQKRGRAQGKIKISENHLTIIVKSDCIDDCPSIFNRNCKDDDISIKFIYSIMNFNDYLEDNEYVEDVLLTEAIRLKESDEIFSHINVN